MNAYFENFNSARYNDTARASTLQDRRIGDGIISFICALVAMFTCSAAIKIEKTVAVFALFAGFFGVIGGIESGAISMIPGLFICGGISLFEFLLLKSVFKPIKKG